MPRKAKILSKAKAKKSEPSLAELTAKMKQRRVKTKTEKVDDVFCKTLEGENMDEVLGQLSDTEQELLHQLIANVRNDKNSTHLDDLWKVDYTRRPPSFKEFVEDPYWLGEVMMPRDDNEGLWPTWKEVLCRDFDLDSTVHNLVVSGSLGVGKTLISCIIFLYRISLARLLRNPQYFFGLSKGSAIFYVQLSISKSVIAETAFGDIQSLMSWSPFFKEECKFDPDSKYASFKIPLGNGIILTAGSKGQHIIGRNAMGVMLDEGNWRLEANPDMRAYQLYDNVRIRIKNRFQKVAGFLPAISILASSAKDESSFTEMVINEIEKANEPNHQIVYRFPVYKIKRHLLKLNKKWFKVAYGLKNIEPIILGGYYLEDGTKIDEPGVVHEDVPPGAKTELVPSDYMSEYKRHIKNSLQSISGISTGGSYRLFSSTMDLERAITEGEKAGIVNPSLVELIPCSEEDDKEIWDYLDHKKFLTRRASRVEPIRNPNAMRFAHVDLATQSLCGIAVCHLAGNVMVDGLVREGKPFSEYRLMVDYDLILTITAGLTKPISFEKIQKLFFWLRDMCNISFGLVSADSFQSAGPLQMMESRGFKTAVLSVDRKKDPYYSWRTGFEEGRIRMYRQYQLMREAEDLMDGDKIDHLPNKSKDTSDAAAASYYSAISSKDFAGVSAAYGVNPGVYTGNDATQDEKPPVAIPIPVTPRRRARIFVA